MLTVDCSPDPCTQITLEATHDTGRWASPERSPRAPKSPAVPASAHFLSRIPQPGAPKASPRYLHSPQPDAFAWLSAARSSHNNSMHAPHVPVAAPAPAPAQPEAACGSPVSSWLLAHRSNSPADPWDDDTFSPPGPPSGFCDKPLVPMHSAPCPELVSRMSGMHSNISFGAADGHEKARLLHSCRSMPAAHFHLNVKRPFLRIATSLNRHAAQLAVRVEEGAKAARTQVLQSPLTLAGVVGVAGLLQHVASQAVASAAQNVAGSASHLQTAGKQLQGVGTAVHVTMAGVMHTSGVVESATNSLHVGGAHHAATVVHATLAAGHAAGVMMQATGGAMQALARWGTLHTASMSSLSSMDEQAQLPFQQQAESSTEDRSTPAATAIPEQCAGLSSYEAVEAVGSVAEALMSVDGAFNAVTGAAQVLGSFSSGLGLGAGAAAAVKGVMDCAPVPSVNQVMDVLHVAGAGMRQAGLAARSADGPLQAVSAPLRATGKVLLEGAELNEPKTVAAAAKVVLKKTIEKAHRLSESSPSRPARLSVSGAPRLVECSPSRPVRMSMSGAHAHLLSEPSPSRPVRLSVSGGPARTTA